jgi:hypothetical protein
MRYVRWLNSYREVSPSGTGLRVFVMAQLPPGGRKKADIEMYDTVRYMTVTGQHLDGTPRKIEPRQAKVAAMHAEVWPEYAGTQPSTVSSPSEEPPPLSDEDILRVILHARNRTRFMALYGEGNTQGYGGMIARRTWPCAACRRSIPATPRSLTAYFELQLSFERNGTSPITAMGGPMARRRLPKPLRR